MAKVGISSVSVENALANLNSSLPGWDFEATQKAASDAWEKELSKISIKSDDPDNKTIFYTSLYHTMVAPALFSDMNGEFKGIKGDVQKAEAAYNWGEGNLNKAIEKASKSGGDWRDELPKETKGYIGSSNNQGGQSPGATQSMPVSWNPTPISLAVNTVKIPGQDTNVNLLAAGGYYTALGVG